MALELLTLLLQNVSSYRSFRVVSGGLTQQSYLIAKALFFCDEKHYLLPQRSQCMRDTSSAEINIVPRSSVRAGMLQRHLTTHALPYDVAYGA